MIVEECAIRGVCLVRGDVHGDSRGELRKLVSEAAVAQLPDMGSITEVLTVLNQTSGTVRGLHFQASPCGQSKTLWVSRGAVTDVLVDLRPDEPTYGTWCSVDLSDLEPTCLHIPAGIAHGYQTLEDDTELVYLIRGAYVPDSARTLRWDDPLLDIAWPRPVTQLSQADKQGAPWPVAY